MMDNQPTAKLYQLSSNSRMYIFVLLFLLYFFDYVDRTVVTSLFPFIQRDWGISDAECGMLVSAVYWSILIFTFPVSILVDRWSRKKTIGLMATFWSIATAACAFMPNFKALFGARTAIGIGEAGYAPGGSAMISGLYPEGSVPVCLASGTLPYRWAAPWALRWAVSSPRTLGGNMHSAWWPYPAW
jgi:predicted MFS family arabinose efflux permease